MKAWEYKSKYTPELPGKVLDLMAKGKTIAQVCAALKVSKQVFFDWLKQYPDFANAYDLGQSLAEAHWETNVLDPAIRGEMPDVKEGLLRFKMSHRFHWTDRQTLDIHNEPSRTEAEIDAQIERLLNKERSNGNQEERHSEFKRIDQSLNTQEVSHQ